MINNFSCFKVIEKKNEQSPDYRLSAKIGDKYVDIGAGWVREAKNGKYISFKLSEPYKDKAGFGLVEVPSEIPKAPERESEMRTSTGDPVPFPNDVF